MKLSKLELATKIFGEIKSLDEQIIQIDKFAMMIANDDVECSFELKVNNLTKKNKDDEKAQFDEDGSLVSKPANTFLSFMYMSPFMERKEATPTSNEHLLKSSLSVTVTMQMLGVMLVEKQAKRDALIKKLERMGVK